jgi:alanine-synthesizing transaminase
MYAFVGVDREAIPDFDDQAFALELLEKKHVLITPGSSFNVPYRDHFRITTLPRPGKLGDVFGRMEEVLEGLAA